MLDMKRLDRKTLAKALDFSILPKHSQEAEIREGCAVTRQYGFAAFYTSSAYWTPIVKEELAGMDDVEIGTGIAFPFGCAPATVKAFEVEDAVQRGCTAVDMVMNIGALKDRNYQAVREELRMFVDAAGTAVTRCILEVCFLADEEIAAGCDLVAEARVQYAKTSSGQFEGPSMRQFLLMRETLRDSGVKLKVAGVKFPRPQNAFAFLHAGADRLGTRAAPEIVDALDMMRQIHFA
ncbi:MAG: deoxyribose-phosphate aldolase [Candidatus Nealsonbacteria bacterium]|nr:deoxyribose-phosphate aldolase [Candidatus Nealsonbacteria bacterium]